MSKATYYKIWGMSLQDKTSFNSAILDIIEHQLTALDVASNDLLQEYKELPKLYTQANIAKSAKQNSCSAAQRYCSLQD